MFRTIMRYAIVGLIILAGLDLLVLENRMHHVTHDSLPRVSGKAPVSGIANDVDIVRDDFGIAHVYAQTDDDAFFGMGYAMAQDRLFQMDYSRRMAEGRLSELFGPATVRFDKEARVIGYQRTAEEMLLRMPAETRQSLDAFTAGVNAAMDAMGEARPVEFHVLGYRPEPWTALDSASIAVLQFAFFSNSWETELLAYALAGERGEDVMRTLLPLPGGYGPSIIPAGEVQWNAPQAEEAPQTATHAAPEAKAYQVARALLQHVADTPELHPNMQASNCWAVSGSRTASGKPIFSGDPHLNFSIPSTLYEIHVKAATFDIVGIAVPGLPAVYGGHNRFIAFSPTVSNVDSQDLYIEQAHPRDPEKLYVVPGGVKQFRRFRERIVVRGAKPVELVVRATRHGPVLNDLLDNHGDDLPLFALRWAAQDDQWDPFTAAFAVMRAHNWDEFRAGLALRSGFNLNTGFASADGDIGYALSGVVPRRAPGHDPTMPAPGDVDDYEWTGWISGPDMPAIRNPARGFVVSANNWISADYPYYLQQFAVPGFRAARIEQVLSTLDNATVDDMQALQLDDTSLFGMGLAEPIARAVEAGGGAHTPAERAALDALRTWDGRMTVDSASGLLVATIAKNLTAAVFGDEMSAEVFAQYRDWIRARMGTLYLMVVEDYAPEIWDDRATEAVETRDDILAATFRSSAAALAQEYGSNVKNWAWGDAHVLRLSHRLSAPIRARVPVVGSLVARYFNAGAAPQPGSWDTPRASGYNWEREGFAVQYGAAWRFVVDLHDVNGAHAVLPGGASGQPASEYYADQSDLYLSGTYRGVQAVIDRADARVKRRTVTLTAAR